jgi:hypothetical protein
MKKTFLYITFALVLTSACSSESEKNEDTTNVDSAENVVSKPMVVETDSGRLEIQASTTKESPATLYYASGKVKAKGYLINGKPGSAWVYYDENGNVIRAEHHSESGGIVRELDKNDFTFRLYDNKALGVKFEIPSAWKEIQSPNPALLVSFQKTAFAVFHHPSILPARS